MSKNQQGFAHLGIILAAVVLAVVSFVSWRVYKAKSQNETTFQVTNSQTGRVEKVTWSRTGDGWKVSGMPPTCPEPLLNLPVDISQATLATASLGIIKPLPPGLIC